MSAETADATQVRTRQMGASALKPEQIRYPPVWNDSCRSSRSDAAMRFKNALVSSLLCQTSQHRVLFFARVASQTHIYIHSRIVAQIGCQPALDFSQRQALSPGVTLR